MFQLTAVTQIPFAYIYSAMLFGGLLLIVHWLLIVRGYVLRREFASRRATSTRRGGVAMKRHARSFSILSACVFLAIGVPVAFALGLATLSPC